MRSGAPKPQAVVHEGVAGQQRKQQQPLEHTGERRRQAEARDRVILRALLAAIVVSSLVNSTLIDHVEALFFAWGCGIALAGPRRETG